MAHVSRVYGQDEKLDARRSVTVASAFRRSVAVASAFLGVLVSVPENYVTYEFVVFS